MRVILRGCPLRHLNFNTIVKNKFILFGLIIVVVAIGSFFVFKNFSKNKVKVNSDVTENLANIEVVLDEKINLRL